MKRTRTKPTTPPMGNPDLFWAEHAAGVLILDTILGACVVVPADVNAIGPIFEKRGMPEQRIIYMRGGHKLYVLDSRANISKLIGPQLAEALHKTPKHAAVTKAAPSIKKQLNESLTAQAVQEIKKELHANAAPAAGKHRKAQAAYFAGARRKKAASAPRKGAAE